MPDVNLLVGMDHPDDAAVYLTPGGDRLIQTVDLIAPIVNEPDMFGKVACANSLSDVYAMGGRPFCAMNIACFPQKTMPLEVLRDAMIGAIELLREAGCTLVGGHTVADDELKFGFSVSGIVEGGEILSIDRAEVGQVLVLTKPIGTGVMNKALKAGKIDDKSQLYKDALKSMTSLNARGGRACRAGKASAATDITGFGLLGHCAQFAKASKVTFEVDRASVPVFEGVRELIKDGYPAGRAKDNRVAYADRVGGVTSDEEAALLFDPQTSGGILGVIPEQGVEAFMAAMGDWPFPVRVIGRVVPFSGQDVVVR
jgi:selenide, water dikinase